MYRREIPHLPNVTSRKEFVELVFDLGLRLEYGYDTLITAVEIGDRFISHEGHRIPYTSYKKDQQNKLTSDQIKIITELVPQVYSRELAYVSLVISADINEDDGFQIEKAAEELENGYVYKMQWEISMMNNFCIRNHNFITLLVSLIPDKKYVFDRMFWDLSRVICMDETLLHTNPITITLAIIILIKRDKLRAQKQYNQRIFQTLMIQISKEYEIPLSDLLLEYIKHKLL